MVAHILGLALLCVGTLKMYDLRSFLDNLLEYELLALGLAKTAAVVLPALEVTLGICLLVGVYRGGASAVAAGLLVVFAVGQLSAIARDLRIGCGCFGNGEEIVGVWTVTRTAVLALLAGWLAWRHLRGGRGRMAA